MRKLIALLFLSSNLLAVGGAPPVQSTRDGGNDSALSKAFGVNVTAGNTLVVMVGQTDTGWTMSSGPSNSCGDTFTEVSGSPFNGTGMRIRVYTALTTGGCSTITMGSSVSAPFDLYIAEYNNMATSSLVNCTATGSGNSTSLTTSNCTTTETDTTLVTFGFTDATNAAFTAGSGYTIEQQGAGTGHSGAAQDKNVTATGSYTGDMTSDTSGNWASFVVGLKNATQSGGGGGSGGSITTTSGTGSITTTAGTGSITVR